MAQEVELAAILCSLILGGEPETRHDFTVVDRKHYVRVDCETASHVVEIGIDDRRSTYDSLHQALFAAELTGKLPMIVVIDTNGIEENAQFQVETVARATGVTYLTVSEDFLLRWQMTAPFRADDTVPLFGMPPLPDNMLPDNAQNIPQQAGALN